VLVGGTSFYDRKEIRDVLAYLKLLVNPQDEISLLRVINTPGRGIGQTTVTRLVEAAVGQGKPVWDALANAEQYGCVSPAVLKAIGAFRELIGRYRKLSKAGPLVDMVRSLVDEIGYRDELARLYPNPDDVQTRWASVEEVVNAVGGYCQRESRPTLSGFVQEVALGDRDTSEDKESRLAGDAVALMTLHSAKGLEFPAVYMVGMEEGLLPHKRSIAEAAGAIDEERRLCYVGLTRAERRLTLTMALTRRKWGKARPTLPSRFLYEITGQADNPNYLASVRKSPGRAAPASNSGRQTGRQ
jgi:DNA helicase-2/ATP-dependent DNA helicase PcrA